MKHITRILIITIFLIFNFHKIALSNSNIPKDQDVFTQIIEEENIKYINANNNIIRTEIRESRKNKIKELLQEMHIKNWIGTIENIDTLGDGDVILSITLINSNIILKTWNNILSDLLHGSIIKKKSNLYNQIRVLSHGDEVNLTGHFFSGDLDHVYEISLTEEGSMNQPEFIFKFKDIQLVKR